MHESHILLLIFCLVTFNTFMHWFNSIMVSIGALVNTLFGGGSQVIINNIPLSASSSVEVVEQVSQPDVVYSSVASTSSNSTQTTIQPRNEAKLPVKPPVTQKVPAQTTSTASRPMTNNGCYQYMNNLKLGSTGSDVIALQTWLIDHGYNIPEISSGFVVKGTYSTQTSQAVSAYQRDQFMPVTGDFGPLTQAKLNAVCNTNSTAQNQNVSAPLNPVVVVGANGCYLFNTNMMIGNTGADVAALQDRLISEGYSIPEITSGLVVKGTYDVETSGAVSAYQAKQNMPSTGFVGQLTREKLNASCNPGVVSTPVQQLDVAIPMSVSSPVTGSTYATGSTVPITWGGNWSGNDVFNVIWYGNPAIGSVVDNLTQSQAGCSGYGKGVCGYGWNPPSSAVGSIQIQVTDVTTKQTVHSGTFTINSVNQPPPALVVYCPYSFVCTPISSQYPQLTSAAAGSVSAGCPIGYTCNPVNTSSSPGACPTGYNCDGNNNNVNSSSNIPNIVITDITADQYGIYVSYVNNGTAGTGNFLVQISSNGTYPGNPYYPFPVPTPGVVTKTGGFGPQLIGLGAGAIANVTATIVWQNPVSGETNNTFSKVITIPGGGQSAPATASCDSTGKLCITITAPTGGENLKIGQVYRIKWTSTPNVDSINIGLSFGPGSLNWIGVGDASLGYFDWTVNSTSLAKARIEIVGGQKGVGTVSAYSSDYFNFTQ